METSTKDSISNINPKFSFPICIDHERQILIPQYVHPIITSNIDYLYAPRNVLIDPKTGQKERFREKWSEKENLLFFDYLSVNFYQWQFHKGEFYKWLSNNVFKKYTHRQIENRWSQICSKYNKILKERQKGINKEWVHFDKVHEIMVRQNLFNKFEEEEEDDDDNDNDNGESESNSQGEDTDKVSHERIRTSDEDENEEMDSDSDTNDEYNKQLTKVGELSDIGDKIYVRESWTFEEKILLMDIIKEHINEYLQDRINLLKWISKNHLPKFHWKTIKNKLSMLSPTYANKKARLKKIYITEQDLELWAKIDDFFQFLNNKRNEMKTKETKNVKKYNYYKKRQKKAKNERKRNPKTDLMPSTLKYHHGISYDDQKLLKYGHSLLKYTEENDTDEIRELLRTTRWPEKLESLKIIPPKYVNTDTFEIERKHSSLTYSKMLDEAEQLIFKPNYSNDTFNLMIEYLSTPFKGGLTRNIDTFIDQEVGEMIDSIEKARREYETNDVEIDENDPEENVQEDNHGNSNDKSNPKRKLEDKGNPRKRVADGVKESDIMDNDESIRESYLGSEQESDYEEKHNDKYKKKHKNQTKKRRVVDDINENDLMDYGCKRKEKCEDNGNNESGDETKRSNEESGHDRLFCYKCGTAGHVPKYCSLYSSEYFINMRKKYSSVIVEFALRQLLDSIGFIFQNNIQRQTHHLNTSELSLNKDHTIENDHEEHSFNEINDLLHTETQGESSNSINYSGIHIENNYSCTTDSAKPTKEPTIKWDTVLRAAEMAGFDATVIKNTHARISKYFDKENQFKDFTSILESSRNNVDSTDYLDGPDQLKIWRE
ncbi:hypothetical protein C1645_820890 [Glomus cerebriforme]|uniref:CCHC-type domain-containing protein n=1 Tax=Glomus cerebriforme TaxID=658196 RepID=A0A397T4N6_9GLOM|nr:hypothetical protein C1645_820890 [Glomus cerebriforme]